MLNDNRKSLDFFRVFSLRRKYLHPFTLPSLPHSWRLPDLGLALVFTDLWSCRRSWGVHVTEISIQISALTGVWTSDLAYIYIHIYIYIYHLAYIYIYIYIGFTNLLRMCNYRKQGISSISELKQHWQHQKQHWSNHSRSIQLVTFLPGDSYLPAKTVCTLLHWPKFVRN